MQTLPKRPFLPHWLRFQPLVTHDVTFPLAFQLALEPSWGGKGEKQSLNFFLKSLRNGTFQTSLLIYREMSHSISHLLLTPYPFRSPFSTINQGEHQSFLTRGCCILFCVRVKSDLSGIFSILNYCKILSPVSLCPLPGPRLATGSAPFSGPLFSFHRV